MQNVILISVDTLAELADLQMNGNFICRVAEDGSIYRGDVEGGSPIKVFDSVSSPRTIRQVTAVDSLLFTDFVIECTGTTYNLSLPEAAGGANGQIFFINNSASGTINLVPFGTEGIQSVGNAPFPITTGKSVCICINADSNGWLLLSQDTGGVGGAVAWGSITGTLSSQTDLQTALDGKVDENVSITGATKTKITYDAKGLVTAGADATTADIADSTNKRYVTDADLTDIGNLSGINTGDQTSIVGITGTKAQFDTAVTDGNFMYVGDAPTTHTHAIADVTGLQTALDAKQAAYTFVGTLASDQATGANVTPVTLTGLVFSYAANSKYRIWFMGNVQPTAATTGCGFQFDLSSAVTSIAVIFDHQLANTGTMSGGHSIADDASVGVSSGMPATSTYPVRGDGLLITTANAGTAQLRFRSETTAVTTCKAGFTLVVEKIG